MTVLRHRLLSNGLPLAGKVASLVPYGATGPTGYYRRVQPVHAVSDSQGWLSWDVPGGKTYLIRGLGDAPVLVGLDASVSTTTVTEATVGTLPPTGSGQAAAAGQAGSDLVTESELAQRLAGITADLTAALTGPQLPTLRQAIGHRRRISASSTPMYANNTAGFGAVSGTATDQVARLRQRSARPGRNVAIEFCTVNGPGEQATGGNGSDLTVRAAVEYPAGTFYPAYGLDGRRDITVTPDGGVGRLFVPGFEVPANTDWWIRIRQRGAVGAALLYTVRPNTATEWASGPSAPAAADLTVSNTGAPTPGTGLPGFSGAPSLVSYEPYDQTTPCVVVIGDSIATGHGEDTANITYMTSNAGGFLVRALSSDGVTGRTSPGIPFLNLGCGSELAQNWVTGGKGKSRLQLLDDIDARTAWVSFSNDIFTNTLAKTQTDTLALWTLLANRGMRVVVFTVTPRSSSTDNWATVGNQTTSGSNATTRVPYNKWLRAGAPIDPSTKAPVSTTATNALLAGQPGHPLYQVVDVCPAVETAQDSGIWKGGMAQDGTHPTAAGHTALAAPVYAQAVPTVL